MPRNPLSGVFTNLLGTEGFPNTTIESEKYNNYIGDIAKDLNDPRPITNGGTGAINANAALANLGGEKSTQQIFNYNADVFYPGSFYSIAGATGAPIAGHAFVGIAVSSDSPPKSPPDNLNVVIRAYDQSSTVVPGRIYVRERKNGGAWSAWSMDGTGVAGPTPPVDPPDNTLWWDSDGGHLYVYYNDGNSKQWVIASPFSDPAQFLLKAGDTMQGTLTLAASPVADLDAANKKYVTDQIAAAVASVDLTAFVNKTGAQTMAGPLTVTGAISGGSISTSGGLNSGSISAAGNISCTGAFSAPGGINSSGGDIRTWRTGSPGSGVIYMGSGVASYLYYDGANWTLTGGSNCNVTANIICTGTVYSGQNFASTTANVVVAGAGGSVFFRPYGTGAGAGQVTIDTNGTVNLYGGSFAPGHGYNGGFLCKTGDSNSQTGGYFNLSWQAPYMQSYVDNTYIGALSISDYRTKKNIAPLPSTWGAVKALHPIKYSMREFTPDWEKDNTEKRGGRPFVENNDDERWGFIAHELQETLVKTAATGKKDASNVLQSPDLLPVVAALTKALQEAMERIEKLEARA